MEAGWVSALGVESFDVYLKVWRGGKGLWLGKLVNDDRLVAFLGYWKGMWTWKNWHGVCWVMGSWSWSLICNLAVMEVSKAGQEKSFVMKCCNIPLEIMDEIWNSASVLQVHREQAIGHSRQLISTVHWPWTLINVKHNVRDDVQHDGKPPADVNLAMDNL